MSRDDELLPRAKPGYSLGQDVSAFSLADLVGQIEALRAEIARLEAIHADKQRSQAAAAAFFKPAGSAAP